MSIDEKAIKIAAEGLCAQPEWIRQIIEEYESAKSNHQPVGLPELPPCSDQQRHNERLQLMEARGEIADLRRRLLEREISNPLEYCTYIDKDGKRKFLTDFVPQVIAAYEVGIRKYQEGQYPGAVYNAMEDALTEHFLNHIEDQEGK